MSKMGVAFDNDRYLAEQTVKLLRQYLRERGNPKSGPLLVSRQGRLGYAMARVLFSGYAEGLPGESVTIHQLRHSFGSERAGKIDALLLRDLRGTRVCERLSSMPV